MSLHLVTLSIRSNVRMVTRENSFVLRAMQFHARLFTALPERCRTVALRLHPLRSEERPAPGRDR